MELKVERALATAYMVEAIERASKGAIYDAEKLRMKAESYAWIPSLEALYAVIKALASGEIPKDQLIALAKKITGFREGGLHPVARGLKVM